MKRNRRNTKYLIIALCSIAFQAVSAFAQSAPVSMPTPPTTKVYVPKPAMKTPPRRVVYPPRPRNLPLEREDSEKSIAVDGKVNISLCVLEGNLKVNGWDRNEIRVFVKNGSRINFNVLQKNKQTSNPVWVMVTGFDETKTAPSPSNECLYGGDIEIDAPREASVNVKGQETTMMIDSVRRASIKTAGGDIALRNIAEGIDASTYEGDVSVENSAGAMNLESATGNIFAFEAEPSEIGDVFRAKTRNGAIALQGLEHRQLEINSISGSVSYNGELLSGGVYNFGTSNGAITLAIPTNSSCKVNASYGYGGFNSEIPIDKTIENKNSRGQNIIGTIGSGSASLNLTTASGAIRIRGKK